MTNYTLELLKEAGWTSTRDIDIDIYINALEEDDYEINSLVFDFLKNYGGLKVSHPDTMVPSRMDEFHFDAKEATESYFYETVEEYMLRVKEKLVVVGECRSGHMVILLSHSGKMYAGYDSELMKLGDNIDAALVALCEGKGIEGV